jgi:hypothetical protein
MIHTFKFGERAYIWVFGSGNNGSCLAKLVLGHQGEGLRVSGHFVEGKG